MTPLSLISIYTTCVYLTMPMRDVSIAVPQLPDLYSYDLSRGARIAPPSLAIQFVGSCGKCPTTQSAEEAPDAEYRQVEYETEGNYYQYLTSDPD